LIVYYYNNNKHMYFLILLKDLYDSIVNSNIWDYNIYTGDRWDNVE